MNIDRHSIREGERVPDVGQFEGLFDFKLDPGTDYPLYVYGLGWLSLKDAKGIREFLKAAQTQLKAAAL